ncbi:hypothetical protein AVEN_26460-1, partial [Araneus ventricosus]
MSGLWIFEVTQWHDSHRSCTYLNLRRQLRMLFAMICGFGEVGGCSRFMGAAS